ncbi:hypothetical protein H2198_010223 [Neophaeococcomyces mojaviensis]|uniref:Uncharacterized protein n=1 Tax=Neophaeococcomyces mojaviensis TaxID=3383035 RepID=A0ACC2ZS85_9EURO|nr:hypothetical protein H2198_010223 [Knufia sp. JES_112]
MLFADIISQSELLERINYLESLVESQSRQQHPVEPVQASSPRQRSSVSTQRPAQYAVDIAFQSHDREGVSSDVPPVDLLTNTTFSPVSSTTSYPASHQPIAHEVGMLSLANATDPKYLGPSSGLTFANLLYAAAPQSQGLPYIASLPPGTVNENTQEILPAPLPLSKDLRRFIDAYFTVLGPHYPFLHEATFLSTAEDIRRFFLERSKKTSDRNSSQMYRDRHAIAQLYLVIFLGAKHSEIKHSRTFQAEAYLSTAMTHVGTLALHDSLRGLQTLLLLVLCSLHSPNGLNAWFLRSTLLAGCVDLGIHRKMHYKQPYSLESMKHHNIRSGIFWSAYSLDRTLSVVLGRPLTLRDEAFDIGFPGNPDGEEIEKDASTIYDQTLDSAEPPLKRSRLTLSPSTPACFSFRFDRIIAEIKLMLHRVSQSPARFPWPSDFPTWQEKVHKICSQLIEDICIEFDRLDVPHRAGSLTEDVVPFLELKYHSTMMLLYRPSPCIPRPSALALRFCFESAMETIRLHSELCRSGNLAGSWLDAHTTFISGITICYCLWMSPQIRQVTPVKLFAYYADMVKRLLVTFGKTWSVAASACKKFEALAEWTKSSFQYDMLPDDENNTVFDQPIEQSNDFEWPEMPTLPLNDDIDWAATTIDYDNAESLPNEFQEVPDWFALEGWLKETDSSF